MASTPHSPSLRPSLDEYLQEEANAISAGQRLLAPEQVMERLGISWKQLKNLHSGYNRQGLRLPYVKLGSKTIRYRLRDVVELEWKCRA